MMTNLFSSFDPCSSTFIDNWINTIILLLFMNVYWILNNNLYIIIKNLMNTLHNEFKTLIGTNYSYGSSIIFMVILILILLNNFLGLYPYIYTSSSHLVMTLAISLPIWLTLMLYGWLNNTKHMFAHLVPSSTPIVLMPFMVLIESISNIIRPITLSVRLAANMIAGHLLLTLLGNQTAVQSSLMLFIMLILQITLLMLESAVALIQSYVFSILSVLYSSEVI